MMGTVDETGKLDYGQVFVQYSGLHHSQKVKVVTGKVVIAKNPCFHAGDLRKFDAVNEPSLSHMVDCVVFPSRGLRSHADEMSGSDLDGDMYFVCWDETLISPGENRQPMDYTKSERQLLKRPVTENDMIDFIGRYIESDQLGVIANAHLVHADAQDDGIFSEQCIGLAQLHSDAVDFPKTGKCQKIPFELRPQNYPHYMQKEDKPVYTSSHIIARLFDQARSIERVCVAKMRPDVKIDEMYIMDGYQSYKTKVEAIKTFYKQKIKLMFSMYGIETEEELVTGNFLKLKQIRGSSAKKEGFEIAELISVLMKTLGRKIRELFFEEFGGESCEDNTEILKKASALYYFTYTDEGSRQILSLPWLFVDQLIALKKRTDEIRSYQHEQRQYPLLHRLSTDIINVMKSDGTDENSTRLRKLRQEIFISMCNVVQDFEISVDLIAFGSMVTGLDMFESSLDVLVVQIGAVVVHNDIFRKVFKILKQKIGTSSTDEETHEDNSETATSFYFYCERDNIKI